MVVGCADNNSDKMDFLVLHAWIHSLSLLHTYARNKYQIGLVDEKYIVTNSKWHYKKKISEEDILYQEMKGG